MNAKVATYQRDDPMILMGHCNFFACFVLSPDSPYNSHKYQDRAESSIVIQAERMRGAVRPGELQPSPLPKGAAADSAISVVGVSSNQCPHPFYPTRPRPGWNAYSNSPEAEPVAAPSPSVGDASTLRQYVA
jgi:hypothetical protein